MKIRDKKVVVLVLLPSDAGKRQWRTKQYRSMYCHVALSKSTRSKCMPMQIELLYWKKTNGQTDRQTDNYYIHAYIHTDRQKCGKQISYEDFLADL